MNEFDFDRENEERYQEEPVLWTEDALERMEEYDAYTRDFNS